MSVTGSEQDKREEQGQDRWSCRRGTGCWVQRINPWGGRGEGKQQEYHRVVGIISVISAALNSQWLGGRTVGMG